MMKTAGTRARRQRSVGGTAPVNGIYRPNDRTAPRDSKRLKIELGRAAAQVVTCNRHNGNP